MDIVEWWEFFMKLNNENGGLEGPNLVSMVLTTWWAVWKARNSFIFNSIPICPISTIRRVQKTCSSSIFLERNKDVYHTPKIPRWPSIVSNNVLIIFTMLLIILMMKNLCTVM